MKSWRLTASAQQSLTEIFIWTFENFGEQQAIAYRDNLINRINSLAKGEPPHARPCNMLMPAGVDLGALKYHREGGHYIICRDYDDRLEVPEFFHKHSNLPFHLERLL